MAKNKVTDWSTTASDNEDRGGIDIRGTAKVSNFDNALREMMAQVARVNDGTDPVADTWSFGDPVDLTKRVRLDAGAVTAGQTRVLAMPDLDIDLAILGKMARADISQSFTPTEKAQLLANIGAGYERIGDPVVISNVASVTWTGLSAYRDLLIVGYVLPATDGVPIYAQVSSDNGSSWIGGTNYLVQEILGAGASVTALENSYAGYYFSPVGVGNASDEGMALSCSASDFNSTRRTFFSSSAVHMNSSGGLRTAFNGGIVPAAAHNALRIMAGAGNLASGQLTLMGIRG